MDWRDIKDVFRVAGNVERVEVFKDKDERSKGLAVVKFESVVDAVNAICILYEVEIVSETRRIFDVYLTGLQDIV